MTNLSIVRGSDHLQVLEVYSRDAEATPLSTLRAAANYRPQSASHGEGGGRRSASSAEMVGLVLKPAQGRVSVPEAGREAAAWAGRGGAEQLAEAEALAGGAGKGAGPEEGETLKRKQQQAEPL